MRARGDRPQATGDRSDRLCRTVEHGPLPFEGRAGRGRPRAAAAVSLALVSLLLAREAAAEQAPPGLAAERELVTYTVQEGDTCERIAERIYGDGRYYYVILDYNPGPPGVLRTTCDRRLRPGLALRLPRRVPEDRQPPDARVTTVVREVRSRPPEAERWSAAAPGQGLFRGWRVNTLERSAARLTFRDDSIVHLREETLVIIYGPTAGDARRRTSKASLERGALRARLGELSGRTRLDVETPTAIAELNGGDALVSVDDDETSRVANHTGRPARVANRKGGGPVLVQAGMGTTVRRGKSPEPPRPLLHAPRWLEDQSQLFVSVGDVREGVISGAWQPVPGASGYRVELSDPEGGGPLGATGVPGHVNRVELRGFPPGLYRASVSALDPGGLEGPPSDELALRMVALEVVEPSFARGVGPSPPAGGARAMPRVLAGARLVAPEGLRCSTGEGEPGHSIVLSIPGMATLQCVDAEGRRSPRVLIDVAAFPLRTAPFEGSAAVSQLRRGERATVRLVGLDASGLEPGELGVVGGPGVTVGGVSRLDGGDLAVTLAVALDAPPESFLEVQLRRRGERRVVLGRVAFGVDAPLPASRGAPAPHTPAPARRPLEPRLRAVSETSALAVGPFAAGVRDERRRGSGLWVAAGWSSSEADPPGRFALGLGFRVALLRERLRVDLGAPVGLDGQEGGLAAAVSSRVAAGRVVGAAVELGAWVPFAADQSTGRYALRLLPSVDLSFRAGERVTLRTRQGIVADAGRGGTIAWSSGYAADVWVAGPLTLGAEALLALGSRSRELLAAPAAGITLSLESGPLVVGLTARFALTSDAADLFGRFAVLATLRGGWDR